MSDIVDCFVKTTRMLLMILSLTQLGSFNCCNKCKTCLRMLFILMCLLKLTLNVSLGKDFISKRLKRTRKMRPFASCFIFSFSICFACVYSLRSWSRSAPCRSCLCDVLNFAIYVRKCLSAWFNPPLVEIWAGLNLSLMLRCAFLLLLMVLSRCVIGMLWYSLFLVQMSILYCTALVESPQKPEVCQFQTVLFDSDGYRSCSVH